MDKGASLRDHATHEPSRAVSALRVGIVSAALLLAGCVDREQNMQRQERDEALRGVLRLKINRYCLDHLPAGPTHTRYNDWDEVVGACSDNALYQSNTCPDPAMCLREMFPAQGMSAGTAKTEGLEAKPAGPVAESHAPHPHSE